MSPRTKSIVESNFINDSINSNENETPLAKKRGITKLDIEIGEKIKTIRRLLGLTQAEVSKMLGITFQQLQKYEQGVNRISATMLWYLAKILGIDIKELYGNEAILAVETKKLSIKEKRTPFNFFGLPTEGNDISQKEWTELQRHYVKIKDPLIRKKMIALIAALTDETNADIQS